MKKLLALSFLMSFGLQAGTLKAIYKNDAAPSEYKYLGVFKNKLGDSEYVVTFGKGMNYRSYNVGYLFATWEGATSAGQDEETKIKTVGVTRDALIKLSVTDLQNRKIFEGNYRKHESAQSKQYAKNVDKLVEAQFDKYRRMHNPVTMADVRNIFRQLEQDENYTDSDSEFPSFDLQIEAYVNVTAPSTLLSRATVSMDGKDAISKQFLEKGNKWFKDIDEAGNELLTKLESDAPTDGLVFASYSPIVKYEGLSPRLEKVLQKFLKVEVLEIDGFECEDSYYSWTSATWILKDGSSVSYSPGTECD